MAQVKKVKFCIERDVNSKEFEVKILRLKRKFFSKNKKVRKRLQFSQALSRACVCAVVVLLPCLFFRLSGVYCIRCVSFYVRGVRPPLLPFFCPSDGEGKNTAGGGGWRCVCLSLSGTFLASEKCRINHQDETEFN